MCERAINPQLDKDYGRHDVNDPDFRELNSVSHTHAHTHARTQRKASHDFSDHDFRQKTQENSKLWFMTSFLKIERKDAGKRGLESNSKHQFTTSILHPMP